MLVVFFFSLVIFFSAIFPRAPPPPPPFCCCPSLLLQSCHPPTSPWQQYRLPNRSVASLCLHVSLFLYFSLSLSIFFSYSVCTLPISVTAYCYYLHVLHHSFLLAFLQLTRNSAWSADKQPNLSNFFTSLLFFLFLPFFPNPLHYMSLSLRATRSSAWRLCNSRFSAPGSLGSNRSYQSQVTQSYPRNKVP